MSICKMNLTVFISYREACEVDSMLAELQPDQLASLAKSKPFLGVPFSVKDCFEAENLAHTAGLYSRKVFF